MALTSPPSIPEVLIQRIMGGSTFDRGRSYAEQGMAHDVSWNEACTEVSGRVRGSGGAKYRTRVRFTERGGVLTDPRGSCTCPMQVNCKHVVALILTSNLITDGQPDADLQPPAGIAPAVGRAGMRTTPGSRVPAGEYTAPRVPVPADEHATQPARLPSWQKELDALVSPPRGTATHRSASGFRGLYPSEIAPPLGLRLELRVDKATAHSRYGAAGRQQVQLVARPVQRNAKGQWVTSQVNWDSFRWSWSGGYFDARQSEWMHSLLAVSGVESVSGAFLRMNAVVNPVVWDLLRRAPAMGVTLVGPKDASVTLHDAVTPVLDVTSPRSRITLRPRILVADKPLDAGALGVIGTPGHGVYWWDTADHHVPVAGRSIQLAPTVAPLPAALESLIVSGHTLEIPGAGRDAFLASYYPRLRQQVQLVSSDASVDLPDVPPPTLVLTIRYTVPPQPRAGRSSTVNTPEGGSVVLEWSFEYTFAGSTISHVVDDAGDTRISGSGGSDSDSAYRDVVVERRQFELVTEALSADAARSWGGVVPRRPDLLGGHPRPSPQEHHSTAEAPGIRHADGRIELPGMAGARFVAEAVPLLQDLEQVRVDLGEHLPAFEEVSDRPSVSIATADTETRDWFDLAVSVHLGGTEVPFDQLFRSLAEGQEHFLLADGRYFALDQPEFVQLRRLIEEARLLQDREAEGLRISRYQAGLWDELMELAQDAEQSQAWRESVAGLLDLGAIERTPVPPAIDATLRPYQEDGFAWLAFLWDHGLGGVLADDMGLGKTLQTLSLICHAHASGTAAGRTFLVVAPTSVVPNWASEAGRFAPDLSVEAVNDTLGRSKADLPALVAGADVVVVSYTLFRLDYEAYAEQEWAGLILDEAQFVKNPATKASQHARTFPAPFKLAITGTPLENNLMELWSLFAITAPGLFPSAKVFAEYYQRPIERESDGGRLAQLRRRIRPLILRRTKEVVAKELPPKQEQVIELELLPKHRTVYQRHLQRERQKVLGLLGDLDKNRFEIFRSLTMLRRLCLDASLVDEKYASTPSSKLEVLFEQLEDIVAEGHRALIFSQFTGFLGKAAERLEAVGIEYVYLDGSTRRRGQVIEKFKTGKAPVFLISLKAGGFGLNLAEADYCFLLDPWWNPASENQAVDRAHRIGQRRQVMVYRLVAKDTIEEKVMALKQRKAELFAAVMDDDAMFSTALTAGDIRGLFE